MRRFSIFMIVCTLCSGAFPLSSSRAAEPATIITARDEFTIPFRYDQELLSRLQAREVVLFVSVDEGRSWNEAATQPIDHQEFQFEPTGEGEYWFSVSIRDSGRRLHPDPKKSPPGLKVVVDRQNPELQLQLTRESGGRVGLSWKIKDAHADVETLILEFRNTSADDWKMVYIAKAMSGQTAWKIQPGQLPEVRGQVFDTAGNVTQNLVVLGELPVEPKPIQKKSKPVSNIENISEPHEELSLPVLQPVDKPNPESVANDAMPLIIPKQVKVGEKPQAPTLPSFPSPSVEPQISSVPMLTAPMQTPAFEAVPQQSTYSMPETYPYQAIIPAPINKIEGVRSRHVNGHQFHIDYQVAGVGPSGVGAVELFITQDNGQQWWRYGVDADLKSPMEVSVPKDGRYGFHFRIHSGVGNAEPPPQPRQKPQIDVFVDSHPPQLQLLKSYQGHGPHINQLTVQWRLHDDFPAEKPVSLYYSANVNGPWQQVDGGIQNTGTFSFELPDHAPTRMYLRMVAFDAAGNTTEQISREPLLIDLSRPTARVITIDAIR
ncbi:hypothetical protein [Rubinisphaera italica]|uniref:hypothetical protein n=1 Tax=Rubinisphaera italica TaxID=2527969 RepID=UPI0011B501D2|nr:hypothetical protein [Rubinisphaera italica]